jgi:hypothetical protein
MPGCPSGAFPIGDFNVQVACAAYPSSSSTYYEGGDSRRIQVYRLTATASRGTPGQPGFIAREVQATVGKCRMVTGAPPGYECP